MRKSVLRVMTPVVLGGAILGAGSGIASAAAPHEGGNVLPAAKGTDDVPTLNSIWDSWNEGGAHVGYGVASMVSAAWLGVPRSIIDLPKEVLVPINHVNN